MDTLSRIGIKRKDLKTDLVVVPRRDVNGVVPYQGFAIPKANPASRNLTNLTDFRNAAKYLLDIKEDFVPQVRRMIEHGPTRSLLISFASLVLQSEVSAFSRPEGFFLRYGKVMMHKSSSSRPLHKSIPLSIARHVRQIPGSSWFGFENDTLVNNPALPLAFIASYFASNVYRIIHPGDVQNSYEWSAAQLAAPLWCVYSIWVGNPYRQSTLVRHFTSPEAYPAVRIPYRDRVIIFAHKP